LNWALIVLGLVFSASMALFGAAVHQGSWWFALFGVVVGVVFLGLGGLLVPAARKGVPEVDKGQEKWILQFFGAFCMTEVLIVALLAWVQGNQTRSSSTAYQILGLLIFLALLGAGVQGMAATGFFFLEAHLKRQHERALTRA
jgi:hypothetical protein